MSGFAPRRQNARSAKFEPWAAATGVGSLPHRDADEAVRLVARYCPEVPFWPQLPGRGPAENMVCQPLHSLADRLRPLGEGLRYGIEAEGEEELSELLAAADPSQPPHSAAGLLAFESAFRRGRFPRTRAVKGQLIGPLTLAGCLRFQGRPLTESPLLVSALGKHLARCAADQIGRLQEFGLPVLLWVDEPVLAQLLRRPEAEREPLREILNSLVASIQQAGALAGIHCCSPVPVGELIRCGVDLVSFDAVLTCTSRQERNELGSFLDNGGIAAFGIIPTGEGLAEFDSGAAKAKWLSAGSSVEDITVLARQTLLTASCGLGLLSLAQAAISLRNAQKLSRLIRPSCPSR